MNEVDDDQDDDSLPLRELNRLAGGSCVDCQRPYTARDAVASVAMGFKNSPRCSPCMCRRLSQTEDAFRNQIRNYVSRRDCYLKAWRVAERMDGVSETLDPKQGSSESGEPGMPRAADYHAEWDAGDMGCGELVMALRLRMKNLPAGNVIKVSATDPAAPEDIPAWCRLIGHSLVAASHPSYYIRRKGD